MDRSLIEELIAHLKIMTYSLSMVRNKHLLDNKLKVDAAYAVVERAEVALKDAQ